MDALSDVLRVMRLQGGVFLHGTFHHPWCIRAQVDPKSCAPWIGDAVRVLPYHYVLEGCLRVGLDDGTRFEMGPGDSILFPHNDPHVLGSDLDIPPVDGSEAVVFSDDGRSATMEIGAGNNPTRTICGFLSTEDISGNPVLSALPTALRLDLKGCEDGDWIQTNFHYGAKQIAAGRRGSDLLMSKVSELLFADAITRFVETLPPDQKGWLAGLKDPFVSRALALMHRDLARPWTVEELGRRVGLSRSALAARFAELLEMPPKTYLGRWRIHVAAQELMHGSKSTGEIAREVGYESEASFTRAFRRVIGQPPAAWRRRASTSDRP